jgi:hypothetical protein
LCDCLTRDGSGQARFRSFGLTAAGNREDFLFPELLEELELAFTTKKTHIIINLDYDFVLDTLYFLRSLIETLWDTDKAFLSLDMCDLDGFWDLLHAAPDGIQRSKAIKYILAWPMAKWLRNDTPKCPEWIQNHFGSRVLHFPLRGGFRQHFKNMLASSTNRMRPAKLFLGLLQGTKRGCAPVGEDFVISTMVSHKESLTQALPTLSEENVEIFEEKFESLWKRNLKRTPFVRKIGNPGFKASLESKRDEGGRAGFCNRLAQNNCDLSGDWDSGSNDRLFGFAYPELLRMYELGTCKVASIYGWHAPTYSELMTNAYHETLKGPCEAMVAPILEPLKCRLITKGPSIPYWASMTAQKDMWTQLQSYPQFRLTGEPVTEYHFHEILNREKDIGVSFDKWVSGDYSAATDGLSTQVNTIAFDAYQESVNMTIEERHVTSSVLGCHKISYPKTCLKKSDKLESMMQTNGQLMGCPLSFPILCAINLVAYWSALEEFLGKSVNLVDLPCLINGDDILFRSNDAFYAIWKKWIEIAGFTLSVGKNYISPNFLTVNSESWLYNPTSKRFRKIDFLNCGLLLENAKGPATAPMRENSKDTPFIAKMQKVIETACSPERALKRYTHYNKDRITHLTQNGNYTLFGSPETGGLGLTDPGFDNVYYTVFQNKLSAYLYKRNCDKLDGVVMRESSISYDGMITSLNDLINGKPQPKQKTLHIVLRDRLEPMREDELSLMPIKAPYLSNMQLTHNGAPQISWQTKRVKHSIMKDFRSKVRFTKRLKPKLWSLEPRQKISEDRLSKLRVERMVKPPGLGVMTPSDLETKMDFTDILQDFREISSTWEVCFPSEDF